MSKNTHGKYHRLSKNTPAKITNCQKTQPFKLLFKSLKMLKNELGGEV
jgi:hypothetical protein